MTDDHLHVWERRNCHALAFSAERPWPTRMAGPRLPPQPEANWAKCPFPSVATSTWPEDKFRLPRLSCVPKIMIILKVTFMGKFCPLLNPASVFFGSAVSLAKIGYKLSRHAKISRSQLLIRKLQIKLDKSFDFPPTFF